MAVRNDTENVAACERAVAARKRPDAKNNRVSTWAASRELGGAKTAQGRGGSPGFEECLIPAGAAGRPDAVRSLRPIRLSGTS